MGSSFHFSGHESFQCRNLWLKKGFDFIEQEGGNFNSDEAVLSLGVGKNMTTSIRYWMEAMGLKTRKKKKKLSELASLIFSDGGWDPYLENIGSMWLLHYELVSNDHASIYNLAFNHFRKHRTEFTKDHLITFLKNRTSESDKLPADSTLETDIGVFVKTYVRPTSHDGRKNIEDQFSSLLLELNLLKEIEEVEITDNEKKTWYKFETSNQESLPNEVLLYAILDNVRYGNSITIQELLNSENSPGSIFLLTPDALITKIEALTLHYDNIVYTDDGGIRQIQIKDKESINPHGVLTDYYGRS
ncbi:MAG: DUF4007 family protein [Candidatus Paceibacterota bacterium]